MTNIDNNQDIIDVRDIIERVEELEAEQPLQDDQDLAELDTLKGLLDDLRGYGGDHQWDGHWYPVTLINDDHFVQYAQELAEDLGMMPEFGDAWPGQYVSIDWDGAAQALQQDYTSIDYNGATYWYR